MFPIISISNAVCAVLCAIIFGVVWRRYQTQHQVPHKYFALFYLYLMILFVCAAVPGLVTEDGIFIALAAIVGYTAMLVAVSYLLCVPLLIYGRARLEAGLFYPLIVIGLMLAALNVITISPAVKVVEGPFVYYLVQESSLLRVLVGAIPMLVALSAAIMFFREGRRLARHTAMLGQDAHDQSARIKEQQNTHRSYMIAAGLGLLVLAGFANFIIYSVYPGGTAFLVAAGFADAALVVIALGIRR